ncbi:MAG: hypothetical protein SFV21_12640 [Rhodospirillaceae bacterium]|nr:hypothetical protein [Rhodospirillaceae bacterium]
MSATARKAETTPLIEVEAESFLHWVYQRQRADVVIEHGVGLYRVERAVDRGFAGSMMSDSAAMVEAGAVGGTAPASATALHPDAETTHEAVRRLRPDLRDLVINHAKAGLRPDWAEGKRTRLIPVRRAGGDVKVEFDKDGRPWRCPVEVINHPAHITFRRDVYLMWFETVAELVLVLRPRLVAHALGPPSCSPMPWRDDWRETRYGLTLREKFGIR